MRISHARALVAAGGACAVALAACVHEDPPAAERSCAENQALRANDFHGSALPDHVLALTFDDGPGARTAELSAYLKSEGIRVGFFVNGKNVPAEPAGSALFAQVIADGHVIGNHTQHHVSLTGVATKTTHPDDATVVAEITATDALIAPFVTADRFMFRAPYGDWDPQDLAALGATPMSKYVGPIKWEIGNKMGPAQAVDWDCWQPGSDGVVMTVAQCNDLYLQEIESVKHGIVLMHDPYFIGNDPSKGGTVDMVKMLVPMLKARGYSFVRVDEIPEIAAALPPLPQQDAGAADGGLARSDDGGIGGGGGGGAALDGGAGGGSASVSATAEPARGSTSTPGGDNPDPCVPSPQPK